MHMVHVNSKYVDKDGTLNGDFLKSADGLAVLGFMFELNSTVWKYYYITHEWLRENRYQ